MMKDVEIEALRPFNKTPQGDICEFGERFSVPETRADELERLNLAKRTSGAKAMPAPDNKTAETPANKAIARKAVKPGGEG